MAGKGSTELIFDDRVKIEELLKLGCKIGSIARSLGRSDSCIKQEVRRGYGREAYNAERVQKMADLRKSIGNQKKRKNLNEHEIVLIKKGIDEGLSMHKISSGFKISPYKLRQFIQENKIKYTRKNYASFEQRLEVLEMQIEIIIEKLKERR